MKLTLSTSPARLHSFTPQIAVAAAVICLLASPLSAAPVVRSGTGATAAAIQGVVDQFRSDLGPLNLNQPGSFPGGRREINWDGVPDSFAAPNTLPGNFFNSNSPRGVVLSTAGTGFEVSADSNNPTSTPVEFGHINANYPDSFAPFSPERLFTARGSTITDVNFFVPGSPVPASVSGFGVVFTDVDLANVTSLQFFDLNGVSLGTFFAPNIAGSQTFSFLGVFFNAGERVARVRITSGNQVLAPGNNASDLVVMDDFIYAEPQPFPAVNTNTNEGFSTIQAAITDANTINGHTIVVQPGTYSELVTVSKALTLQGAKFGVDARDASRGTGESIVNGAAGSTAFRVTVDNVTIDGFTVQGNTDPNNFGAGIVLAPNTSGTRIRNNIIRNNICGIHLANDTPKVQTVIERNLFANNNQPGPLSGTAIYTDQFFSGGTLVNVLINDNTFTNNNNVAVLFGATTAGSQSRVVISNNIMSGNGNGVLLFNTAGAMVTRNAITASVGSQVVFGGGVNDVTLSENTIENGNARGIRIGDLGGGGANSNIAINCNSIQGNGGAGLQIDAGGGAYTGPLDATGNWWGSASGPTIATNPGGTGQTIVDAGGQVNFAAFLTERNDQQAAAPGFQCNPSATVYAVDTSNNLLRFDSTAPGTILSSVPITGLEAGEEILGIDFRPTTGELFAIGSNERLYVIDTTTAAATLHAPLSGSPNLSTAIAADFNPVPDLAGSASLRVITPNDENLRINATTGQVIIDTPITPFGLQLHAAAYLNVDLDPGTGTALHAYDFGGDAFVTTANANGGSYTTTGLSGIISTGNPNLDVQTFPGLRNVAYASLQIIGRPTLLYLANLTNGLITPLGDIGSGIVALRGMAVAPVGTLQFSGVSYLAGETSSAATIAINRVGGTAGAVSVRLRTQDGTATAADYTSVDQIVTFASGETTKLVEIPLTNDSEDEGDETINLLLSDASGGAFLSTTSSVVLTISGNDEATPTLALSTSGTTTPGGQLSATVNFTNGVAAGGSITFNVYGPNDTSCGGAPIFTATVPVNGDGLYSSGPFTPTRTGTYIFVASYSGDNNNLPISGACNDPAGAATVNPATVLANIATRLRVETGDNVLIGGIIVTGTLPKRMLVRAIGPSSGVPDSLGDPYLELYAGSDLVAENNNWREAPNQQEIIDSTIAPSDDRESAILVTLNPGLYTAVVSGGVDGATGVGVVEAYDLDRTVDSKFGNIATRGRVQTGSNVMIGGLIILGDNAQKVLVRAIGPSLPIDGKLADPTLELVDANGDTLATNDNWRDDQQADIEATGIPPSDDAESAIIATLAPAPYTAIVRGANDATGVGLVEVYALE